MDISTVVAAWIGYTIIALGALGLIGFLAALALDWAWRAVTKVHGLSIVFAALREWYEAHPEKRRRAGGDA